MEDFNWHCPYCNTRTTITSASYISENQVMYLSNNREGKLFLESDWVVCPNPECKRTSLSLTLSNANRIGGEYFRGTIIKEWRLLPPSKAKIFPDYIPKPILDDYIEACLIVENSPKASATLSRRCLQGMIRDFWRAKPDSLYNEIESIREQLDPLVWQSIEAVRKVGNIGAHMERDINQIIDVDQDEAELLIELIETLFKEWYIHRHGREARLNAITEMADKKKNPKAK